MEYNVEKISNKIKTQKRTKKILKYIALSILIVLFVINLILSFEENTHILGIYMYNIVSESMEPTFNKNDLVVVQKVSPSSLKKGDIITFENEGRVISHRILEISNLKNEITIQTKGDNNDIPDPYQLTVEKVYGKVVFSIRKIGKFIAYIQNARGFLNVAIFVIIVFILISLRDKQKNTRKIKRRKYEIKKVRDSYNLD